MGDIRKVIWRFTLLTMLVFTVYTSSPVVLTQAAGEDFICPTTSGGIDELFMVIESLSRQIEEKNAWINSHRYLPAAFRAASNRVQNQNERVERIKLLCERIPCNINKPNSLTCAALAACQIRQQNAQNLLEEYQGQLEQATSNLAEYDQAVSDRNELRGQLNYETAKYDVCSSNRDGDQLGDSQDSCPDQAGPYSKDGCPDLTLTPSTLPPAVINEEYGPIVFGANGGVEPFNIYKDGMLVDGLIFSDGQLSGTPSTFAGNMITFSVVVEDAVGNSGIQQYQLQFVAPTIRIFPELETLPTWTVGLPYTQQITATGGSGDYSFTLLSGLLPDGVSLDSDGLWVGEPIPSSANQTYHFEVTAIDSLGIWGFSSNKAYTLPIAAPTITLTQQNLSSAIVGLNYSALFSASGGKEPYNYTVSAGALPEGLLLSPTGALTGVPTINAANQSFRFTVTATDFNGFAGSLEYSIGVDLQDQDGDGSIDSVDCQPNNNSIYPGAPEIANDGIDQDCDGSDLIVPIDRDGDGWTDDVDCQPNDGAIHPGATEIANDGIDQDCDGVDLVDAVDSDNDGSPDDVDCAPSDSNIFPQAKEIIGNFTDENCDSVSEPYRINIISWTQQDCGATYFNDILPVWAWNTQLVIETNIPLDQNPQLTSFAGEIPGYIGFNNIFSEQFLKRDGSTYSTNWTFASDVASFTTTLQIGVYEYPGYPVNQVMNVYTATFSCSDTHG